MKIADGLYGFLWTDYRANNANAYLIDGGKKILVDPGHAHLLSHVVDQLAELSLRPEELDLIIATHGHPDHVEALQILSRLPALTAMHTVEAEFAAAMGALDFQPSLKLQEGDLRVGGMSFRVLHTPGHSPGSLCLYWIEAKALFSGDVIFRQGLGRTDLPGGSGEALKASITRLSKLDVEYLLPGHGEWISGAENVKANFDEVERMWFGYL